MAAKTCVITGASRGIGLATALRFARGGYRIVAAARNEADLKQAAAQITEVGGECDYVVADVGTRDGVQRMIDAALNTAERVDVLVNNAGYAPLGPIDELSLDDYQRTLAINIAAVFHATQAVWPIMRRQGSGIIVNVSSRASVDPFPGFAVYGACKAWVNIFTKATADEGKPFGIRVFAVAPGGVETGMFRALFPDVPADQVLQPDDVAAVIESLCDEQIAKSSGETVFIQQ